MSGMYAMRPLVLPRRMHPKGGSTPLALRRICGVCRHFSGTGGIAGEGVCGRYRADVQGRAPADRCEDWARRTAGVDAPLAVSSRPAARAPAASDPESPDGCDARPGAPGPGLVPVVRRKGGPKPNPAIEARRARLRILAADGLTMSEAARVLGVTWETVRNDCKATGIRFPLTPDKLRRPHPSRKTDPLRAELQARIAAGGPLWTDDFTARDVAARHGCKAGTAYALACQIRKSLS